MFFSLLALFFVAAPTSHAQAFTYQLGKYDLLIEQQGQTLTITHSGSQQREALALAIEKSRRSGQTKLLARLQDSIPTVEEAVDEMGNFRVTLRVDSIREWALLKYIDNKTLERVTEIRGLIPFVKKNRIDLEALYAQYEKTYGPAYDQKYLDLAPTDVKGRGFYSLARILGRAYVDKGLTRRYETLKPETREDKTLFSSEWKKKYRPLPNLNYQAYFSKTEVSGIPLVVNHASLDFDFLVSARSGTDEAIAFFRSINQPVVYLVNEPFDNTRWYTQERRADFVFYSEGGEHSINPKSNHIAFVGGFYGSGDGAFGCLTNALQHSVANHFALSQEDLHIHLYVPGIYFYEDYYAGYRGGKRTNQLIQSAKSDPTDFVRQVGFGFLFTLREDAGLAFDPVKHDVNNADLWRMGYDEEKGRETRLSMHRFRFIVDHKTIQEAGGGFQVVHLHYYSNLSKLKKTLASLVRH